MALANHRDCHGTKTYVKEKNLSLHQKMHKKKKKRGKESCGLNMSISAAFVS